MANDNQPSYARIGFAVVAGVAAIIGTLVYLGGFKSEGTELLAETYYDKPVTGLSVGSAVNFRGVKIGEVRQIALLGSIYDVPKVEFGRIYILMAIDKRSTGAPHATDVENAEVQEGLRSMIDRGLRVTVSSSGITGLSRIECDFHPDGPKPAPIAWRPKHVYIPPHISLLDNFADSATKVMNQINKMDLDTAWSNVNFAVESMAHATESVKILMETRQADLDRIADNLVEASDAIKDVSLQLRRNPSLLIRERRNQPLPETED